MEGRDRVPRCCVVHVRQSCLSCAFGRAAGMVGSVFSMADCPFPEGPSPSPVDTSAAVGGWPFPRFFPASAQHHCPGMSEVGFDPVTSRGGGFSVGHGGLINDGAVGGCGVQARTVLPSSCKPESPSPQHGARSGPGGRSASAPVRWRWASGPVSREILGLPGVTGNEGCEGSVVAHEPPTATSDLVEQGALSKYNKAPVAQVLLLLQWRPKCVGCLQMPRVAVPHGGFHGVNW